MHIHPALVLNFRFYILINVFKLNLYNIMFVVWLFFHFTNQQKSSQQTTNINIEKSKERNGMLLYLSSGVSPQKQQKQDDNF